MSDPFSWLDTVEYDSAYIQNPYEAESEIGLSLDDAFTVPYSFIQKYLKAKRYFFFQISLLNKFYA